MKRLLLLTMIIGSFQLTYGQKDKREGLKKITNNSRTENIVDLSVFEELEGLSELAELSELSNLSELSSLAALYSLSTLADENNAGALEDLSKILGKEMEVILKSLGNLDIDLEMDLDIDPDVDIDFDHDIDIDIDMDEMVDMNEIMDMIHDVMKNIEIPDVPDDY